MRSTLVSSSDRDGPVAHQQARREALLPGCCLNVGYRQFLKPGHRTRLVFWFAGALVWCLEKICFRHCLSLVTCNLEIHKSCWHGIYCKRGYGDQIVIITRWKDL